MRIAVRFSGARPMVARRCRICLKLNPASIRIRVSSVSTYVQLPAEPLPKIVRRTATADIRNGAPRRQYILSPRTCGETQDLIRNCPYQVVNIATSCRDLRLLTDRLT